LQNETIAGSAFDPSSVPPINTIAYLRTLFKFEHFTPLSNKITLLTNGYTGFSFFNKNTPFNNFILGGINEMNYNQLPFIGLLENEVASNNTMFGLIGLQYQLSKNFFGKARFNIGFMELDPEDLHATDKNTFYDGYGLTIGYRSLLGPIELTAMRSDNVGQFRLYLNAGYYF
jgi:NTE family protein